MIKYTLHCANNHEFEAWFGGSQDFEQQKARSLLRCPVCANEEIEKSLMAPNVVTHKGKTTSLPATTTEPPAATGAKEETSEVYTPLSNTAAQEAFAGLVREIRKHVEATTEDVGKQFAEEARKIHYEETEARGIRGEATAKEVSELQEEGIEIALLPSLPDEHN